MHGMFKKDFPKLLRYSDRHDKIIEQLLPKVFKKFVRFSCFFFICHLFYAYLLIIEKMQHISNAIYN